MRNLCYVLFIFISAGYTQFSAGHIPYSNRQEWDKAGLLDKEIRENAARLIDFNTDTLTGIGENDEKLRRILENLSGDELTIIYFPEGEYTFYETINIDKDNVVIQGAGSDKTKFYFENNKNEPCIYISGGSFGTAYAINSPVLKGSNFLTCQQNISSLKGKWVQFYEEKNGYGQITQVLDVNTPSKPSMTLVKNINLTLKDKATKNYTANDLQIAEFNPRRNIGVENLFLKKVTDGKGQEAASIYFIRAVNCWVEGVESAYTSQHHISIVQSAHIDISGNYLHHAQNYGEGGYGYGVIIHHNSTNCLVENNILKHLRHSIALQKGANCNVVTYNYSYDRRSVNDDILSPEDQSCDLVLHGNYAWGNLFEENNVAAIAADNTHGANGPYNAFVRNRARADGLIALEPGWYPYEYGLVLYKAEQTALLGNIISNYDIEYNSSDIAVNIFGKVSGEGDYEDWSGIIHRGSTYRKAKDNPNAYHLYDESYYYTERPDFLPQEYTYPSMGPRPQSGIELTQNIPARERAENGGLKTVNIHPTVYTLPLTIITKTDVQIDTTYYGNFSYQPFKIADSLQNLENNETYFFAGIENRDLVHFNNHTHEIMPDLYRENSYIIIYKRKQSSSNKDAYAHNGQRKFIKTTNGSLFNIYESMGHVFLESKSNADTWNLLADDSVNLFIDKNGASSPALDYAKNDQKYTDLIGFTYQENNELQVRTLFNQADSFVFGAQMKPIKPGINKDTDLKPAIAWGGRGAFLIVWQDSIKNKGINYRLCDFRDSFTTIDSGLIAGSNDSSASAAVSVWFDSETQNNYFDIVWEQQESSTANALKYMRIDYNYDGSLRYSAVSTVSKATFEKNTNAAIVSIPQGAIVSWLIQNGNTPARAAMRNALTQGHFYIYDSYARSVSINKYNNNRGYFFGWSKYYSGKWFNYFVTSDNLSRVQRSDLTQGNEFQLSSANNKNDIYLMAYNHDNMPYTFQCENLRSNIKGPSSLLASTSKGFTFSRGKMDFDYLITNVKTGDQRIVFDDEISQEDKNVLYTNNFQLSKDSKITFDEGCGLSDSVISSKFLGENEYISLRMDLLDSDNNIIQTIKTLRITNENLEKYRTQSNIFKKQGMLSTQARMRISLFSNIKDVHMSQINYFNEKDKALDNEKDKTITLIHDFALKQNYPNPFNPSTTIGYQLPQQAQVTIKVYDVLGREVATLVNELKNPGYYKEIFDASDLAGGLYVCRMKAGSYSEVRKMLLIK